MIGRFLTIFLMVLLGYVLFLMIHSIWTDNENTRYEQTLKHVQQQKGVL